MLALSAFSVPTSAIAQAPSLDLQALSDRIVDPVIRKAAIPGAIVGISLGGERHYFRYHSAGRDPIERDGIVEIGSITKVFTATLLGQAFASGAARPNQPIAFLLPEAPPLKPCTAQITLAELADFRSGLSRMPKPLPPMARRSIEYYTVADFLGWLSRTTRSKGCASAPYLYSNASVGLLGPILANITGRSWERQIAEDIAGPLGMRDTAVSPTRGGRVQGYQADGDPADPWPLFAWYAAGALRSTAQDMLAFGEAALGRPVVNGRPVPPILRKAFDIAMSPRYSHNGFSVGLSWQSEPDGANGTMTYKDGGTSGFNSMIVVDRARKCVVFVVANKAQSGITQLGKDLMRAIASEVGAR